MNCGTQLLFPLNKSAFIDFANTGILNKWMDVVGVMAFPPNRSNTGWVLASQ